MVRSPRSGFRSLSAKPRKPPKLANPFATPKAEDMPAPRNPSLEQAFCRAIHDHLVVEMRYEDDLAVRRFAPDVVFRSSKGKVLVAGRELHGLQKLEPKTPEIGKMRSVHVTDEKFTPDPRFNLNDERYRDRICPR